MNKTSKTVHISLLLGMLLTFGNNLVLAQNVENMIKEKPVKFTGSLSAQFLGYSTTRERSSRDPFVWTLSGSPTLSIYGFSVPFSFVISPKQRGFRQPFNQFGMSPYYKWLTVHAGYRNVNFSRYTLAGHTFLGGGVEATPGNFRLGFVYGRFLKAIEDDSLNVEYVIPTYQRTGYSIKIGYGSQSNYVDLIIFKAKDAPGSIATPDPAADVIPGENLVFGLKAFQRFLKKFTFDLDFGYSIYTNNLRATAVGLPDVPFKSLISSLTMLNNSTKVNWAANASLAYTHKVFGLRLRYQRIQPEYQSMGAYFFNNDLEQITVDPSLYLLQRKLNIRASIGYQRNNLGEDKINNTFRRINSLNVSYTPSAKFSANFSFMDFRINQKMNPLIINDFVDSLQMKQVSTNFSINLNYNFGTKEKRQTVSMGTNYQKFNDENQNTNIYNSSSSQSPFLTYRFTNTEAKYGLNARVNYNYFQSTFSDQSRLGFTLGGNKRMVNNKLNLNASGTLFQNKSDGEANGSTSMLRGRLSYKVAKSHRLNFSLNYINRKFSTDTQNNFNEFLIRFGYSMRI